MTPLEIVLYYADLLILQYVGKPKAYGMVSSVVAPVIMPQTSVQLITFSDVAASGSFILSYKLGSTTSLAWNASASAIQTALRALTGLGSVTVSGSIASRSLSVTFTGVAPPASLLTATSSLLNGSSVGIEITLTETDQTLPLAVQNGFNLVGSSPAIGAQLDILGKYVGVTRSGNGPFGPITLNDADFLTLIKFAIIQNNSGSSLETIESNFNTFFPGQFLITDFQNMQLSYIFSATLGSVNLFTLLVVEGLIPKPMGVGITVFVPPTIGDFFGFSTYDFSNLNAKPFNTYDAFNTTWLWLSYSDNFTETFLLI